MDRPLSLWKPSPNFTPKNPGRLISCVVIHATETSEVDSPLSWLTSPDSKKSSHYLIDKNGQIYHLVHEQNVAWHAGISKWNGMDGVNEFSVGIELVNKNDGLDAYPIDQLNACAKLVASISNDHRIKIGAVVGHCDIAPGRKTDPGPAFSWTLFKSLMGGQGMIA